MSKKFTEYNQFDLSQINKEVLKKWDENSVFQKSLSTEKDVLPLFFTKVPLLRTGCRVSTT